VETTETTLFLPVSLQSVVVGVLIVKATVIMEDVEAERRI
jgi:hypothetical protein